MKRLGVLSLCLFLLLSGCQSTNDSAYSFDAAEIQSIDVFMGGVPAAAVKKTVTSTDDIEKVVDVLNGICITGTAAAEDEITGGIGIFFQINMADGETQTIHIGGNGELLYSGDNTLSKIKAIDYDELWGDLGYTEVKVGEEGLPQFLS